MTPAFDQGGGDARHRLGKSLGHRPPEHRCQRAPQSLPLLAVHRDQAVGHARRQDPPLDSTLTVGTSQPSFLRSLCRGAAPPSSKR